ncbi:tRNA 2'-phosphotransferase Tpt1 [Schizosaccharomyces japonicus yFS275]|uniref:2'-phosphotransferase n=1 Tax=Schizosaccharomyces japonicus (strain yFS275 / FY16936) TaxID=402676 RepID=B6K5D9_SCHJY|nr:tRNA 2'-phosphotransferase Tpt1 [Schizosaccharomyces japonicus yFS275]EEB08743.1 tRNA 2'-phosphotransferase Tpt1 [Schizosaccharomyces japonicus yFS275]
MSSKNTQTRYSRALSKVLRHTARSCGLKLTEEGYARVDDLLKLPQFKGLTVDVLQQIVADNDKQRFALSTINDELHIRANQGHSLTTVHVDMPRITDPAEIPRVVHGTFAKFWPAIYANGLSRMKRQHIHCAKGLFGEPGVVSGIRKSCDVFIFIDAARAMADGVVFYRSENGVILTEGIDGVLPRKFFLRVENKNGDVLYDASRPTCSSCVCDASSDASRKVVNAKRDAIDDASGPSDVWSDDERAVSTQEFQRLREQRSNIGYGEGVVRGKIEIAQKAFDEGYVLGSHAGWKRGVELGKLEALQYLRHYPHQAGDAHPQAPRDASPTQNCRSNELDSAPLDQQLAQLRISSEFPRYVDAEREKLAAIVRRD